jgi:hypothetical protein
VVFRQETLPRHPVKKADEIVVIARGIEQTDRVGVVAQLGPGPHLEQFFHRADTARQGDEGLGHLHHLCLARVHRLDDMQLGQLEMGDFLKSEEFRNDADHPAAGFQRGIGQFPHQSDLSTAIHDVDAALGQRPANRACGVDEDRILARIGAAIDTD